MRLLDGFWKTNQHKIHLFCIRFYHYRNAGIYILINYNMCIFGKSFKFLTDQFWFVNTQIGQCLAATILTMYLSLNIICSNMFVYFHCKTLCLFYCCQRSLFRSCIHTRHIVVCWSKGKSWLSFASQLTTTSTGKAKFLPEFSLKEKYVLYILYTKISYYKPNYNWYENGMALQRGGTGQQRN